MEMKSCICASEIPLVVSAIRVNLTVKFWTSGGKVVIKLFWYLPWIGYRQSIHFKWRHWRFLRFTGLSAKSFESHLCALQNSSIVCLFDLSHFFVSYIPLSFESYPIIGSIWLNGFIFKMYRLCMGPFVPGVIHGELRANVLCPQWSVVVSFCQNCMFPYLPHLIRIGECIKVL